MTDRTPRHAGEPSTGPVLVIGEALIDAQPGVRTPGGAPMNVAVGLGRLGAEVTLATWLGDDADGQAIARHLAASRVRLAPGSMGAARTSTATAELDESGSAEYTFEIEWAPALRAEDGDAELVHIGSIAMFLQPGADDVAAFAAALDDRTVLTLDPNIRPMLLEDRQAAVGRFERLARRAQLVKLSDEDSGWLYPGRSHDEVISALHELGAEVVVITLGAQGAVLSEGSGVIHVPSAPTEVVDTIGAGDAYMSALIHALYRRDVGGLLEVGEFAARAAAVAVSRAGADPAWLADLGE